VTKGRLEAFSDGVIAILITIMVLELHVPEGSDWESLRAIAPKLLAYVVSFIYLGTYWNNHHHLLQAARVVDARVMWANLHLLFWLSLIPFGTAWMGESGFAPFPTAIYAVVQLSAAFAYFIMVRALIGAKGQAPTLAAAIGGDWKGKVSPLIFAAAIPVALVGPFVSFGMFILVLVLWIVPDRRIEREMGR